MLFPGKQRFATGDVVARSRQSVQLWACLSRGTGSCEVQSLVPFLILEVGARGTQKVPSAGPGKSVGDGRDQSTEEKQERQEGGGT